ncbi:MAG: type II/IV secretion system ATPase subunit, partial [Candidatus Methanomethylicaceae archaeon]
MFGFFRGGKKKSGEEEGKDKDRGGDGGREKEKRTEGKKSLLQIFRKKPAGQRKRRMEFDLPAPQIRVLKGPVPEGRVKAQYKVGLSTVTIVGDRYVIVDPYLSEEDKARLERTASQLLFIIPSEAVRDEGLFKKYLEEYGITDEVTYYFLRREVLGYGPYDVLMNDENIEDIAAWPDGVTCSHKHFGTLFADISMPEEEFNRYIEKFVHISGKSVSLYNPLLSIRLPTKDRLTVTYGREASDRPSFAIRKFPRQPWSITSIMMMGSLTPEMAAWLMLLVKYKRALLVCGPVGSGKTSLINALCSLIPADQVVVTCEDTPELRLARQNWISFITRESSTVEAGGDIGMFDLVRHALRQPAQYIIVGEVRGEEGRVWAQAIATGHGGITSLHAETPEGALERLR